MGMVVNPNRQAAMSVIAHSALFLEKIPNSFSFSPSGWLNNFSECMALPMA